MLPATVRRHARWLSGGLAASLCGLLAACLLPAAMAQTAVRFATFNASLNRDAEGQLLADLAEPASADPQDAQGRRRQQAANVAEIIQRTAPDVLLINEFDFDAAGVPGSTSSPAPLGDSSRAAALFQDNYLAKPQGAARRGFAAPLHYAHRYTPPANTGIPSGLDLDADGRVDGANDAFGFGNFPGQYGFTLYSRYPIVAVRSFQNFLWRDMPGNLLTNDPAPGSNNLARFFPDGASAVLRLSSKNHVDVTLDIGGQQVHFLMAHPTPPVFDGEEDRNGKRNHDEIRFWSDYIAGAAYPYDDQGGSGGLPTGAHFVIAGDYNADLCDGDSLKVPCSAAGQAGAGPNAIGQLLQHPLVNVSMTPASAGGRAAAHDPNNNGTASASHVSDPTFDTADFNDSAPGNQRVDYVLPSATLTLTAAAVFWPVDADPGDDNRSGDVFDLVGQFNKPALYAGLPSSDHKLVYVDVLVPAP